MAYPTYTEPTQEQAQAAPEYQQQAGLLDQQAALNTKTYAQRRQDTINSYQSALDSINLGLKQAGIQSREQYAGRNLYNAEGDVSGIGQQVGAANVAPYLGQIKNLQTQHESNLAQLGTAEAQSGLDIQNQKFQALQGVLGNLRTSAQNKYNTEVDALNNQIKQEQFQAKLPGGAIDQAKILSDQQKKGRTYLSNPTRLSAAIKQYGKDSVIDIGGRKFLLSAQERNTLARGVKALNKPYYKPSTTPTPGTVPVPTKTPTPKGFSLTTNKVGGLSFFKNGQAIPAATYAKGLNMSIADVLKNSKDPGDQDFVNTQKALYAAIGSFSPDGKVITKAMADAALKKDYAHIYGTSR